MRKTLISIIASLLTLGFVHTAYADGHKVYGPYPITLKGYDGDKTNSVKYTGQMARQVLHDSLKALVKKGDVEKTEASIELLKKYINYRPKINVEEGIPKFINWYKEYYKII